MMNENLKKGKKFGSGQDNKRGGRKPKIYTILKKKGYSADDVRTCINEIAFYTKGDIEALLQNPNAPVISLVIAKAFHGAVNKGDWNKVKEIMEHIMGRPVQTTKMGVEHSGKDGGAIQFVMPTALNTELENDIIE
jgi:hypothetical protein